MGGAPLRSCLSSSLLLLLGGDGQLQGELLTYQALRASCPVVAL